jgi:hypothetical protein
VEIKMVKDKIKEIGEVVWKLVLFLLLPPITLIIAIEFGKAAYQAGSIWGLIIIIGLGILAEILEAIKLKEEIEELI